MKQRIINSIVILASVLVLLLIFVSLVNFLASNLTPNQLSLVTFISVLCGLLHFFFEGKEKSKS